LVLASASSASLAQLSAAAEAPEPVFAIVGFELSGDLPVPVEEAQQILAPFVSPKATIASLQRATSTLEAALVAQGFALHRVQLPPQEVGSKVKLQIVKYVIGKITLEGNKLYGNDNIRDSVLELQEDQAPNFSLLAIQTAIANENPGKQIKVSLKESADANKIDAVVQVRESNPLVFSVSLSNSGSAATGQDRLSLVFSDSNVFDLDHQFSAAYTTSIESKGNVQQLGLNYRVPIYEVGGMLGFSFTTSDVVGKFGNYSSTGAGQTYGVSYSHYLEPVGGQRSYLTLAMDEKRFDAAKLNGQANLGSLPRSSRPITLGYSARIESDKAVWGYNAEVAANWSGGSANNLQAYQSEDPRNSNVNWKALRGGANYVTSFAKGWLWSARGQFQYSPDALISGEQFGLGGSGSVRGTGERPISGDSGWFASVEVTTPNLQPGLQALAFVDAGGLSNQQLVLSPNKPASDQLVSAGLGLRYNTARYGITADYGRVLTGSVLPRAPASDIPQTGDEKIHINLNARF
jgi:hemolysin activation/secretion protein